MKILPTHAAAIAGYSALSAYLPGVRLNLQAPKRVSVSNTISGGASVSAWTSTIAGQTRELSLTVDAATAQSLSDIHDSGIVRWVIAEQNRRFQAIVNVTNLTEIRDRPGKWEASVELTFISEEQ